MRLRIDHRGRFAAAGVALNPSLEKLARKRPTKGERALRRNLAAAALAVLFAAAAPLSAQTQAQNQPRFNPSRPWMDASLSPDQRAALVAQQMTLDEKIGLLHGLGHAGTVSPGPYPAVSNGGAGFVLGVPRLGIPIIQMSDAAYGVTHSAMNGRYSTALPSDLAAAASWDPEAACRYGALIGRELRAQGYNMSLGGGVDLARELRDGRTFEYQGEDPLLAGTMVGNRIKCEQAQHVIADIKHYAVNDQESGRNEVNAVIGERALRETDLLAFEIGIEIGKPGAVMCAYNAVNGEFSCQNKHLLTDVLKRDWGFPGFVVSDWGGTHSTIQASVAGLDNEEPASIYYGDAFKKAILAGQIPQAELDDHVRRILRSEFAAGIVDYPVRKSVVDVEGDFKVARSIAEQSMVLLKNRDRILPLDPAKLRSITVIGDHANSGMISGGGSAQVDPPGAYAPHGQTHVWFPGAPLEAIRACARGLPVEFNSGSDPAAAAALAARSSVAIVFAHQWTSEGMDLPNLSLPGKQDALIEQVAKANPRTIVVLETGTAVLMPWLDQASGVVEAWYGGSKGADALAALLFGNVNFSAKLPITFPRSDADLPHPHLTTPPAGAQGAAALMRSGEVKPTFSVHYSEGLEVGYKWYDAEKKPVLFPFGFGLSYTTYRYSGLQVAPGSPMTVRFTVANTGRRAGAEIAEVYAAFPASAGEPPKRLVGWSKVHLKPGESREVTIAVDARNLSVYDPAAGRWKLTPGSYTFLVGSSSRELPLRRELSLR